ncbi:hypothetical protein ASF27_01695 [Methylobacterium sp. Leaf102]|uniref:HK97 gp10 family phage protein n=1 Tax=Methylobacterium sp. Leaf102 TaxID=1736253 RepID=UPI0006F42D29|nr:HK97 gp10 family phage protein [Methylobacterium sp. Leaf102]KQP34300.1 hypothetical protein ASF27_01695 [Methylobacterium sp. Leaf102]
MIDVSAAFGAFTQGQGALELAPAARSFRVGPGALSSFRLLDAAASVIGVDRISGQLASLAVKMALRSDRAAEGIAAEMVQEMRARVPKDSGTLFNGITWRNEGRTIIVEASAVRGGDDYARWVEFGHQAGGQHADADYFANGDHGAIRRRPASQPTTVRPEPYFWDAARAGLVNLRGEMALEARAAGREERF